MNLDDVVRASRETGDTSARSSKTARMAELLRGATPDEAAVAVSWLIGDLPQGRIGLGPAAVAAARDVPPASLPRLGVLDVDAAFTRMSAISGAGSARARVEALRDLFAHATADEQDFLARLIYGEIRQGALEGVMADAVARATGIPVAAVRRATQIAGSLPAVARAALHGGADALSDFAVQLFRPLQPMLARPADDMRDAMTRLEQAALDFKLDGARVQVHRRGDDVRVYTRGLNEITPAVPELVESVRQLKSRLRAQPCRPRRTPAGSARTRPRGRAAR